VSPAVRLTLAAAPAAALAAASAAACAAAPRAAAPRPMTFACRAAPAALAARGTALLRENGWTVREADSARGVVRATRGPVYAGLGENLTADGPYLLSTEHDGREARVVVQLVETRRHRVVPVESLDDRSNDADRRNFLPVVDGLRAFCGAPTSGRTPPAAPAPTLPPPGGGPGG
jgi:hypothetical protein